MRLRNEQRAQGDPYVFNFEAFEGSFSVWRDGAMFRTRIIRFTRLEREGEILIESDDGKLTPMTVTLTLSDQGECRLLAKGEKAELEEWQVRRRALEDLFFRLND